jgi:hypothetical protein
MSNLVHYLLVFDHTQGKLVHLEEFRDAEDAVAAYSAKEREYANAAGLEIVLVGSDSIETVKLTHANYFDGPVALSKYFVGI